MALIPLVLDSRPAYLQDQAKSLSLLSFPVGTTTMAGDLGSRTASMGGVSLRILPTFPATKEYEHFVLRAAPEGAKVVGPDVVPALLDEFEPSDVLLIIDPRYWPIDAVEFVANVRPDRDVPWAAHGVVVASGTAGMEEYVLCDDDGRVRRISRFYDQVTCSRIDAIAYSMVPLASMERVHLDSLTDLRTSLSLRGMLSRDVPVSSGIIDLTEPQGLLTLNEQHAVAAASRPPAAGYSQQGGSVLIGRRCRIHPSARLVGPLIIQDDVLIEAGATLLGPTTVGAGSSVRRGALVAQSVLARGATIEAETVVRHSVTTGRTNGAAASVRANGRSNKIHDPIRSQGIRVGADASAIQDVHRRRSIYPVAKLALDGLVALVSLLILAPFFLLVAVVIKLESRGPVLFGHEREGRNGKVFRCLKFRTMFKDADRQQRELYATNTLDGPQFKLHNDPRVTRVGAWLRATNIDELPQLINVFLGQMSLVGPRPSPFRENQICVPWRRARLSVRPGITGLWQICRDQRVEGDFHQWIAFDIMYVRHLSLWLDVKILLATIFTLGGMWNVPYTWIVQSDQVRTPRRKAGRRAKTQSTPAPPATGQSVRSAVNG